MPDDRHLADRDARDRITADLDTTLFVEAGAGSGKTRSLVDRVVALVTTGAAELAGIAAITFTDKAGAELRDRIRRTLETHESDEPEVRERCRVALAQLDSAAIGTLHSFAQRLLTEHPIEAGLPPRVEVLDEVGSELEFARRWGAFRDGLLADPALERTLQLLLACGVQPAALDALAAAFEQNWDLVADRVPHTADDPPSVHEVVAPHLAAIDDVCAARAHCPDDEDRLRLRLDAIADWLERVRGVDDELDLLDALGSEVPSFAVGNAGKKGSWAVPIDDLRSRVKEAGAGLDEVKARVGQACARRVGAAIRGFTLDAAEERRRAGQLQFHDLLVMARALLADPGHGAAVRERLHQRYPRLLLDEFQDTDPIQIDLAVRIAAARPGDPATGTAPWGEVAIAPGHLFVVGDPKQSIYRFRRADISTFLTARARLVGADDVVALTANFRSAGPVIDWVNAVFATLFGEDADVALPVPSQPDYLALDPVRDAPPIGPPVAVLGRTPHPTGTAAELRAAEAAEVVATVARVVDEGWSVDDRAGGWRPARLGDVTILIPARTSMPFLEAALDAAHIPYRAESSSLVYATRAVRDVLMVLRAVDDPTNELHVVSALRSPLLGCGDDDLFRFKVERRGRWSYLATQPDTVPDDDPVRAGLEYLRSLHDRRHWSSPSELLERIARDLRAFELGFAEGRPRDVWRRLRYVIDQARAWSEATGGGLRAYLHWVGLQSAEGSRVAEAILPETDDDAVRIMTIHAAKGLEFPVTIVSGMSTVPQGRSAPAEVAFPPDGGVAYRFGTHVRTEEWTTWAPIDEQMGLHERIRLLYVACTRACDHLVVSLHRKARSAPATGKARTNAELLVDGVGDLLAHPDRLPDAVTADAPPPAPFPAEPVDAPMPFAEWRAERDRALATASRPVTVAATALTEEAVPDQGEDLGAVLDEDGDGGLGPGLQKRPRDLDLPPWLKGRYGTAVGRAVHGVLQTIDLATGAELDAVVAAQCEAEAIPGRVGDVAALVRGALGSPSVRDAAAAPHWREVYACTPIADRLLEGYVDLLYRSGDGLVVVDYKTAATDDPAELDRRVDGYRLQGASYALAVAAATGEPVARVTFVFLTPRGPVERHLDDLDGAVAHVRTLVAAGRELVVEEAVAG